mgnify:CR=1 FL=1
MSDRPKIFFAEFLCGGGTSRAASDEVAPSMAAEALAMWQVLVEDLGEFCDVVTPVDPQWRFPSVRSDRGVTKVEVSPSVMPWQQWIEIARDCQAAILVVPETKGLLAQGIGMLRAAGVEVLAPGPETLRLAADKSLTARFLARAGIAHPATFEKLDNRCRERLQGHDHFVLKPRDGCGSTNIRVVDSLEQAERLMQPGDLLQAFCPGRGASILTIASPNRQVATHHTRATLPAVWQNIHSSPRAETDHDGEASANNDGVFRYTGGSGPLDVECQRRVEALTARVLQALPGNVAGFVGIDVILGDDANHDVVIEINPRLTTSYVGMRRMVKENLTRRLFNPTPQAVSVSVPPDSVRWTARGDVHLDD